MRHADLLGSPDARVHMSEVSRLATSFEPQLYEGRLKLVGGKRSRSSKR